MDFNGSIEDFALVIEIKMERCHWNFVTQMHLCITNTYLEKLIGK